jgi:tetratricopeptide (TPR) repeat protein
MAESYKYQFVGRQEELDLFLSLRSLRAQQNALYFEAEGGTGKSKLLEACIYRGEHQRTPWRIPDQSRYLHDALIDFKDFKHHTVAGLRRAIVERLGNKGFDEFRNADAEQQQLEVSSEPDAQERRARLATLRVKVEVDFFQNLKQVLRDAKCYVALFFDTFEVVHNRRVGRWFLNTFLPHPAVQDCLIVFAGRPRHFALPPNARRHTLKTFTEEEAREYFKKKFGAGYRRAEQAVWQASGGRPLLIDLLVHYNDPRQFPPMQLSSVSLVEVHKNLVRYLLNAPPNAPLLQNRVAEVVGEMAYLKRHYNREIYETLHPQDPISYDALSEALRQKPYVKELKAGDIFALHDEAQSMIEQYASKVDDEWVEHSAELYQTIVQVWYPQQIDAIPESAGRWALMAEQLAYEFEHDPMTALHKFKEWFEAHKHRDIFEAHDALWSELLTLIRKLFGHTPHDLQMEAYALVRGQAIWLSEKSQFESAILAYESSFDAHFMSVRPENWLSDYNRLGYCYRQLGQREIAKKVYEDGLRDAETAGDITMVGWLTYNLAHLFYDRGEWERALEYYDKAIDLARRQKAYDLQVQALLVAARLRAQQGETDLAKEMIVHCLRLAEKKLDEKQKTLNLALAQSYAGDVHRYGDYVNTAERHYEQALSLFGRLQGRFDYQAQARSGLGETYCRAGIRRRLNEHDISGDIALQFKAFEAIKKALVLTRDYALNDMRSKVLNRLGLVYQEFAWLEVNFKSHLESAFAANSVEKKMLKDLSLPEEGLWRAYLREGEQSFNNLDFGGRAQRLFEVAARYADQTQIVHRTLDYLLNAATVAQWRSRDDDLRYYSLLITTLGTLDDPEQQKIFAATIAILQAHGRLKSSPGDTVSKYARHFLELNQHGGFGHVLAERQLEILEQSLLSMPTEQANNICKQLKNRWPNDNLHTASLHQWADKIQDLL